MFCAIDGMEGTGQVFAGGIVVHYYSRILKSDFPISVVKPHGSTWVPQWWHVLKAFIPFIR